MLLIETAATFREAPPRFRGKSPPFTATGEDPDGPNWDQ